MSVQSFSCFQCCCSVLQTLYGTLAILDPSFLQILKMGNIRLLIETLHHFCGNSRNETHFHNFPEPWSGNSNITYSAVSYVPQPIPAQCIPLSVTRQHKVHQHPMMRISTVITCGIRAFAHSAYNICQQNKKKHKSLFVAFILHIATLKTVCL